MLIEFAKYSGNGNDFIVIDNRKYRLSTDPSEQKKWESLCQRRTGIGADGVLLLEDYPSFDFRMVYLNSDGRIASMCGNGARCITHFYHTQILGKDISAPTTNYKFKTENSWYEISVAKNIPKLKMAEIYDINKYDLDLIPDLKKYSQKFYINTGVPHLVLKVDNIEDFDVFSEGKKLRYSPIFQKENGVNVNFFEELSSGKVQMRTYERGVEDETLACGTGCAATAIFYHKLTTFEGEIELLAPGGHLKVELDSSLNQVLFSGTVDSVFNGTFQW